MAVPSAAESFESYPTDTTHCVEIVRIKSFSCPYFSAFGLEADIYSVNFCIQSEYEKKIGTKKTPNTESCYAFTFRLFLNK